MAYMCTRPGLSHFGTNNSRRENNNYVNQSIFNVANIVGIDINSVFEIQYYIVNKPRMLYSNTITIP